MLIFDHPSRPGVILVPQVSHAWLAWQIALHWGNRRFLRPAPRAETLAAVLLHDAGWTEHDQDPPVDARGCVRAFDSMPMQAHLAIWRRSIDVAAQFSRYAGLLVAAHHRLLAARKGAALPENDEASRGQIATFVASLRKMESGWIKVLRSDPRTAPSTAGSARRANQDILAACDQISVYLCAAIPGPFTVHAASPSGEEVPIRVEPVGPMTYRLNPWPLEGTRLAVHCEGAVLDSPVFPDRAALRRALRGASTTRLTFTLLRASARVGRVK